ncbi:MAG: RNA methyltransferase [Cyclobacteriaceae bacterium]|nr:MAG: RNA methyltransferase [Cyclobacteriaceae bacterium]
MEQQRTILVTCALGVSQVLSQEIKEHGYLPLKVNPLSVELKGNLRDCMYLNLHLRTASKVLLLIKRFRAPHPDQLYQVISKIPWEDYLRTDGYICVTSFISNQFILDTRFGNQKVKDAIVDRIFSQKGKRPNSGPNRDESVVYLHWLNDDCHLYFDTSGETISKHGYRRIPFKAPLRESLAAALIKSTCWKPGMPLINPMAGSGTLAIEGALMAAGIAPGLLRTNFGFMHIRQYQADLWETLREEATRQITQEVTSEIIINDQSLEALRAAKKNAEWAGVTSFLKFQSGDFTKMEIPDPPGVIILNPEYGSRLGEVQQLTKTYQAIGDFFKSKCAGHWGYIFSGNPDLSKNIGLRTSRKMPFYNGKIECRLLEYELYKGSKKND